jgi:hypothetical protein
MYTHRWKVFSWQEWVRVQPRVWHAWSYKRDRLHCTAVSFSAPNGTARHRMHASTAGGHPAAGSGAGRPVSFVVESPNWKAGEPRHGRMTSIRVPASRATKLADVVLGVDATDADRRARTPFVCTHACVCLGVSSSRHPPHGNSLAFREDGSQAVDRSRTRFLGGRRTHACWWLIVHHLSIAWIVNSQQSVFFQFLFL